MASDYVDRLIKKYGVGYGMPIILFIAAVVAWAGGQPPLVPLVLVGIAVVWLVSYWLLSHFFLASPRPASKDRER